MNAKEANRRSRTGQAAAVKHEPALRDKYEAVLRANAKRVSSAYRATGINVDGEGVSDRRKARGITAAGKVPTLDEVLADATLAKSATARTKAERQRIAEEAAHPIITEAGKRELRALLEPLVAAQAGVQAERIVAGVRDRVAAIMLEALTEGYSVPDTAALLKANLELDAVWQAEMLARTDLISLSNAGSHAAAASLEDGPKFKTWLSAGDDRVRPTHVDANRQTVPIDKPYVLAEGVELQYPGDPAGPDGETINCRCVSVFTDSPSPGLSHSRDGGIHDEPVTAFDAPVAAAGTVAAGFDPLKHPRYEKGRREGGRFAPSSLTPTHSLDLDDEVDERHDQFVINSGFAAKHGMTPDEYLDASSEWLQGQVEGQEIRVRAPVDSVKGILEQGFKTPERMLEEGADVNAWVGRRDLEQHYFGALDPTYGYLSGIPEDNGHPVTMYGEAVFRMKPEVELRSTLTLGDSANVIVDQSRDGLDFVPTDVTHPDQRSIDFTSTGDVLGSDLRQYTGVYVETQTWGGVNVNDVHEIVYTEGTVPDGPTREALGKAGVPWRTVPSSDPNPPPVTVKAGDVLHHRSWVEKDGTPTPMTVTEVTDDGYVAYKLPQDTEPRGDSLREFYWKAGKDADARAVVGAAFDPTKHPRYQRGDERGGQFSPKDGTSTATATREAEQAATQNQEADAAGAQLSLVPQTAERSMGRDVRLTGKLADGKVYRVESIKAVGSKGNTLVGLVDADGNRRQVFGFVEVEDVSHGFQGPAVPVAPAPAGPAVPTEVPGEDIGPRGPIPNTGTEPPVKPKPELPRDFTHPDAPTEPVVPKPPPKPVTPQVSNPPVPPMSPAENRPIPVSALKPGEKFRDTLGREHTVVGPYAPRPRTYVQATDENGVVKRFRRQGGVFVDPGHPALERQAKTMVSHVEGAYGHVFNKTPGNGTLVTKAADLASLEAANTISLPPGVPQIELKATRSNSAAGQYWSRGATPVKVTLRPEGAATDMVSTMHHEMGHYIDHGILAPMSREPVPGVASQPVRVDRGQLYASAIRHPEVMGPVMDAIDSSAAIERVHQIATAPAGTFRTVTNPGTSYERAFTADRKHARYLLEPTEKWARAYEQWQATKNGVRLDDYAREAAWPLLRKDLVEHDDYRAFYGWQWTAEDFAPIEAEIDKMFGRLGWSKSS